MLDERYVIHRLSLQDRDLMARLAAYVEALDSRVREGTGWLIFSADRQRSARVERMMREGLVAFRPFVSSYLAPWRDVALNAYVEIELRQQAPRVSAAADDPQRKEFDLAQRVARDTRAWMRRCDLLLVWSIAPAQRHELDYLEEVLAARYERRLASLVLTPRSAEQLAADVRALDPTPGRWERLYQRLYERSLIAL
ncbi:MAG: hypothetical protein HY691_06080 [Chloroflexi bacterium]|nr:hypothetical protein [Chloroflexota bacterium]